MTSYTKSLKDTNLDEIELVGGKNASLGEMIQNINSLGINVPDGFVVTSLSYDMFLKYNNINDLINNNIKYLNVNDYNHLKNVSNIIKDKIKNGIFPDNIKNEIIDRYIYLSNKYNTTDVDVAVRSSGTSEDMPDASFAGQQDTYLNIRGIDNLLQKIKDCFASLYNERAISYRKSMNYDNKIIKLSVCIQKMIRSDLKSSGVAFSIDTYSGCKDVILINASYGLGETVVSGQVNPDEYIVFKPNIKCNNPIIDKKIGSKEKKLVYNNNNTELIDTTNSERNNFCLSEDNIIKLSKWVIKIEDYYSKKYNKWCPVDVEWGIDGINNELYILQSRPETVFSLETDIILKEYRMMDNHEKKIIISGVAVGDKISTGNTVLINSLEDSYNISKFNPGDILVTNITDPDWEPLMKISAGIITNKGGRTCHAAIVARELGVPAIVGTNNCTTKIKNGDQITLSCAEGEIGYIYEGKINFEVTETNINDIPKINTKIMLNVASPNECFKFSKIPNSGVGLAREEFIINNFIKVHPLALLNYDKLTDNKLKQNIDKLKIGFNSPIDYYINKLSYGIGRIAAAFYPKDVIVRFSDFKSNEYSNLLGGNYYEPHEENPMIGWRGASRYYSEKFKEAFGLECQAIQKVRNDMGLNNVIVMIPFCRTLEECDKVLNIMKINGLERGKDNLKVYLMCEVPSNVILAEEFSKKVDGFSIGSNDLTQLTLGLDRDSELVSHIYNERNPAIKKILKKVIKTCNNNNIKIGICGQGPSDFPDFAEFLIDNNIDTISLTPDSVLKTIKHISEYEKKKYNNIPWDIK
jgi:pyruvate, water dikinase